jgi:hypothetical protein
MDSSPLASIPPSFGPPAPSATWPRRPSCPLVLEQVGELGVLTCLRVGVEQLRADPSEHALYSMVDVEICTVNGNNANGTVLDEGGGIYSDNSVLTLVTLKMA